MRTEQLEYVAAIARLGSFRSAAEHLHISQPALSATVRNLDAWYRAFDVKPSQKLYLAPASRVHIW